MVWVTGRLFINFMFWQQFGVLEGCNALDALRRSRELARSGRDLPWYRRPLWRGVFIASLWFAAVLVLNWPFVASFFRTVWNTSDPHKLVEAVLNSTKNSNTAGSTFAAGILQAILKPLLGIAFVLLFLDSNLAEHTTATDENGQD
jgi:ABC-type Fe3+ transport system permease subunit